MFLLYLWSFFFIIENCTQRSEAHLTLLTKLLTVFSEWFNRRESKSDQQRADWPGWGLDTTAGSGVGKCSPVCHGGNHSAGSSVNSFYIFPKFFLLIPCLYIWETFNKHTKLSNIQFSICDAWGKVNKIHPCYKVRPEVTPLWTPHWTLLILCVWGRFPSYLTIWNDVFC